MPTGISSLSPTGSRALRPLPKRAHATKPYTQARKMMMPMSACGWRGFGLTQRNVSRLFWPRTTLVLVAVWCCLSPLGTAHSERGALPGILENALRLVDLNGNGLISKSEFQASVFNFYNNRVSDDQDVTPEQVRKLFSSGDVDGDENLDVEETTRLLSGRMAYSKLTLLRYTILRRHAALDPQLLLIRSLPPPPRASSVSDDTGGCAGMA